jgi:hypothetical protein
MFFVVVVVVAFSQEMFTTTPKVLCV